MVKFFGRYLEEFEEENNNENTINRNAVIFIFQLKLKYLI